MRTKKIVRCTAIVILCGVMLFSGYKLWEIYKGYRDVDLLKDEMAQYKPVAVTSEDEGSVAFSQIADLQKLNPDVIGWITVPDTVIDYPVVQAADNRYYLRRNIKGESQTAGTIFMDYRCDSTLEGFNAILYGHQMRNGSMFNDVRNFREKAFFDAHPTGEYCTLYRKYEIRFFAFLTVDSTGQAYDAVFASEEEQEAHLEYIRTNAKWYRDVPASDRIITLSTCTYEFDNARAVLVGYLE